MPVRIEADRAVKKMARDYSIVRSSFWIGETGRALRGDPAAQVLALYFITCPAANMIGLYYLPWPTICYETGLTDQGASKGLRRVSEVGIASYDRLTGWVFLPQMGYYQLGDRLQPKDNRISSVQKLYEAAAKSPFVEDFWNLYGEAYNLEKLRGLQGASKGLQSPYCSCSISGSISSSGSKEDEECKGEGDRFEEFWSAFPRGRKGAKGDARKAWAKAISKATPDVIIAAAIEYAGSEVARGQYVKGPSPWLNQECWDDDPMSWKERRDPRGNLSLLEKYTTEVVNGDAPKT